MKNYRSVSLNRIKDFENYSAKKVLEMEEYQLNMKIEDS